MVEVAIVGAMRTAIGGFGGTLKSVEASTLGGTVIAATMAETGLPALDVDEVIMGCIYQGGAGPNVARQAAVRGGLPYQVPAMTVNKLCGSGLKSIALAAQSVQSGDAELVIAGGMESMSTAPYVARSARWGERMGHGELVDTMLMDGLWDCFYDCHMGMTAEHIAQQYSINRQEQDRFALRSQECYRHAHESGAFTSQIAPVEVPQRKGEPVIFDTDEHPRADADRGSLAKLKPAFDKDGTVTVGNASGINDAAAVAVIMSEPSAKAAQLEPLAYLRATAIAGVDPMVMGIGPAHAIRRLLDKTGMTLDQVGLIELNEAFAAQTLAVGRELDWDEDRVNVNGGAIALGHPVGASGARVAVTLIHEMRRRRVQFGIASLCIGGGMGIASLFEV
jgi:acetyl-CoA C-acetyltransferase